MKIYWFIRGCIGRVAQNHFFLREQRFRSISFSKALEISHEKYIEKVTFRIFLDNFYGIEKMFTIKIYDLWRTFERRILCINHIGLLPLCYPTVPYKISVNLKLSILHEIYTLEHFGLIFVAKNYHCWSSEIFVIIYIFFNFELFRRIPFIKYSFSRKDVFFWQNHILLRIKIPEFSEHVVVNKRSLRNKYR